MRRALELAWDAHSTGNIGVGAVLTDDSGAIVAEGRNRVFDTSAPPGRMCNTFLAHAEMDVLAQLPRRDYSSSTLWTTLQPCLLCTSATVLSRVGHVVYLAADPVWYGTERLHELNEQTARRWPTRRGPLEGPLASFASLLPLLYFVRTNPDSVVVQSHDAHARELLVFARRIADDASWT